MGKLLGAKVYSILIKDGSNPYIVGRISGMAEALGAKHADRKGYANQQAKENPNQIIIHHYMTKHQYMKLQKLIEKNYPGLCAFEGIK